MSNLPWTEKYRPKSFKNIVSQEIPLNIILPILHNGNCPHFIFHGPPGTSKTSTALLVATHLFGPRRVSERVIELNASDDRGISVVRHQIIKFAKTAIGTADPNYPCPNYKLIILDEADAMTDDAQAALKKVMEEYSTITRFCFICNYIANIVDPIISRCVTIRFQPIRKEEITNRLQYIAQKEELNINKPVIEKISEFSNGDLRKAIIILQNSKYKLTEITINDIYSMCKYITQNEMNDYLDKIRQNNNIKNVILITRKIINTGYLLNSIINSIVDYICELNVDDCIKAKLLFELTHVEKNIVNGANNYIQLLKIMNDVSNI